MAAQDEPDAAWVARTARLLELTGSIPLGLYECPAPYHRLMSLEMLRWAAGSGRFHFLKDTCRDGARTAARCDVARGTGLSIFNAHATTLLATLRAGAAGFSGIAANYYPAVFARLCRVWESEPAAAERLQRFANLTHLLAHDKYPTRAKRFLGLIGLPAGPTCRTQEVDWTADDQAELEALRDEIAGLQGDGPRR
jgi:4-hydroxy-tetrahydrodipicolinate synthase